VNTSLRRSGIARVLKGSHSYVHTPRSSANGMSHTCTCLCLFSRSWYSFTDPGGIESWVGLGWPIDALLPVVFLLVATLISSSQTISLKYCMDFKSMTPEMPYSSKSRGQRSRSQRDITCAKIRQIINNSVSDRSMSLRFCTDFDHLTLDAPRIFKVNGSKVKIAAWHNVAASKTL